MKPWNSLFFALSGLLLLISPVQLRAESSPETAMQTALDAYKSGDFEGSYRQLDSLYRAGYESVALCYNLGNAAYKLGKIGPAVLWYERSLKQDPNFEDASFNLRLANARVVDHVVTPPEFFLKRLFANGIRARAAGGWALFAVIALWIAIACGFGFFWVKTEMLRRATFFIGIAGLVLSLVTMGFSLYQRSRLRQPREGIVMAQNAYVKSAPEAEGTDLFMVHEGLKVSLAGKQGDWVKITLGDDKSGWMPVEQVAGI